jgi:hypothetical protein
MVVSFPNVCVRITEISDYNPSRQRSTLISVRVVSLLELGLGLELGTPLPLPLPLTHTETGVASTLSSATVPYDLWAGAVAFLA